MKKIFVVVFVFTSLFSFAQVQKEDGTWWDNNLEFLVKADGIKEFGELEICIYDRKRELCIENLITGYEVRVYDASNKEIWNSLWTGKNMNMKFSKKLPTAHHLVIKATRPFVINVLTGTRIYQDKALQLKYTVQ